MAERWKGREDVGGKRWKGGKENVGALPHLIAKVGPRQFFIHPACLLASPWVGFGLGVPDNSLARADAKKKFEGYGWA
jgi:hypothetical protein